MIKIYDLSFSYYNRRVIDGISAEFKKGEICSILGRNGCGKTTLLKLIARLLSPESGSISVGDIDINTFERKSFARLLAYLPQVMNAPSISVSELVSHGRFPYMGFSRSLNEIDKEKINTAITLTNLDSIKHKKIQNLSGGERRRAYIAMLLAQDSEYFLLDEPSAYLDISYKYEIMELLKQMKKKQKSIITVLHDIDIALKYSDKIMIIDDGKLVFFGTPEEAIASDAIKKVFGITCLKIETNGQTEYICQPLKKS